MENFNQEIVQNQINQMLHTDQPYFPNPYEIRNVVTDVNEWPYPRYFRGRPDSDRPFFWNREAGYRHVINPQLIPTNYPPIEEPRQPYTCFQPACNTIFPCYFEKTKSMPRNCVYTSP